MQMMTLSRCSWPLPLLPRSATIRTTASVGSWMPPTAGYRSRVAIRKRGQRYLSPSRCQGRSRQCPSQWMAQDVTVGAAVAEDGIVSFLASRVTTASDQVVVPRTTRMVRWIRPVTFAWACRRRSSRPPRNGTAWRGQCPGTCHSRSWARGRRTTLRLLSAQAVTSSLFQRSRVMRLTRRGGSVKETLSLP